MSSIIDFRPDLSEAVVTPREGEILFLGTGPGPSELAIDVPLNVNAADTTNTDQIKQGGSLGTDLEGSGYTIGVWEAVGLIRNTHDELAGRVTLADTGSFSDHATHVAGILAAAGVRPNAEGMARQATLRSYTAANDYAEMDADADLIQVSNHSYGWPLGWEVYDDWEWGITTPTGQIDAWLEDRYRYSSEDTGFGKYDSGAIGLDTVLWDNPNLLSVWSAGNDSNDRFTNASSENTYVTYLSGNPGNVGWRGAGYYLVTNSGATAAPPGDGNRGAGFDTILPDQNAKNSLVVGAVNDVTADPYAPGDVTIAYFSSHGPSDDGRIKPDVVGNGTSLYSAGAASDHDYFFASGTSMSSPNVAGTALLLIEHFQDQFSFAPRSATTKGVLIHTAFDAGNRGPDYTFGWGLVDAAAAADFITQAASRSGTDTLAEQTYTGTAWTMDVVSSGAEPLKATIAWTDPPGTAQGGGLDVATPALVNDLDLWITGPGGTYYPWTLDAQNPSAPATRDKANHVDNVEQVLIDSPAAGTYTIHVFHSGGTFTQDFSLLLSGATTNQGPPPVAVYETDFASGLPAGWSIADGGADGNTWTDANPNNRAVPNLTAPFMMMDSEWGGFRAKDESLLSPVFDLSQYSDVVLKFDHAFDTRGLSFWYGIGDVDVRVGTGPWQNVARFQTVDASGTVRLDLTPLAAGQDAVQIRWRYHGGTWDLFWAVDNVEITGTRDGHPAVVSIQRAGADPTNAAEVDFTVTFSEQVRGVTAGDFSLTTTGTISGAQVAAVTPGSGPSAAYTVTVATGTGDGTLRLDVSDNDSIVSVLGKLLGGVGLGNGDFTAGETYTIDKTAPGVSIVLPLDGSAIGPGDVDVVVVFSEAVRGVDAADLVLSGTAAVGAGVGTPVNTSGTTWRFPVTGLVEGDLQVTLAPDAGDIQDALGQDLATTTWSYRVVSEIDLVGTRFAVAPHNLFAAGVATVSFEVLNQKANAAGPFDVKFYLSDDADIDPGSDLALPVAAGDPHYDAAEPAAYHVAGLAGGTAHFATVSLAVPGGDPWGTDNAYFIGMVVDADGDVAETNEANNRNLGQGVDGDAVFYDSATTIYATGFSGGLPGGWTVIDGGGDGATWTDTNPGNRSNPNLTAPFMVMDADWAGFGFKDESLVSPAFDLSGYADVRLQFTHAFDTRGFSFWYGIGDVDVRVGGGAWHNVARYQRWDASGAVALDLSSIADGQDAVQVRWRYYQGNWDLYWAVDNIEITGARKDHPVVTSVVRAGGDPTNAAEAAFTVTFSEPVAGVTADDFSLATTGGVSAAQVAGIAPSSGPAATYTVTVATGDGDGTIRLDVSDNDTIVDGAGNPLGGAGTGNGDYAQGESYTIDKTAPVVGLVLPLDGSAVAPGGLDVQVSFSEPVFGVDGTDLALGGTAASGAAVGTPVKTSGNTWRFPVAGLAEGELQLTLAPDAGDIQDALGQDLAATTWNYSVVAAIDLLGTRLAVAPENLYAAGVATASFELLNRKANAAGAFDVKFYLSDDADIDPGSDVALQVAPSDPAYDAGEPAAYHVGGLSAGGTFADAVRLVVPNNDPFGTDNAYFIGMVVDADGDVAETNEANNRNRGLGVDQAGVSYESTVTIEAADFAGGLPAGWTVVDGGSDGRTWTGTNPGNRANPNLTPPFMVMDADWAGFGSKDEWLVTPVLDLSSYRDVKLSFTHAFDTRGFFFWYGIGDVDVRVGGGPWRTVARYQRADASGAVELNLTPIAAGQNGVQIRWRYHEGAWDLYWGIDNVQITGMLAGGGTGEEIGLGNTPDPMDVNNDGRASPLDVLVLVHYLNENGAVGLASLGNDRADQARVAARRYDVNGDSVISPVDVLQLVNHLNASVSWSAGGENELVVRPRWIARNPVTSSLAENESGSPEKAGFLRVEKHRATWERVFMSEEAVAQMTAPRHTLTDDLAADVFRSAKGRLLAERKATITR